MQAPLSILCIDDDLDFFNYLKLLAKPYNLVIEQISTIKDARDIIDAKTHDAYIIDVLLPDGSGLDIATLLRESKRSDICIAVVSGKSRDASSYKWMKERLKINYVIDKPIKPLVIQNLFNELTHVNLKSVGLTPLNDLFIKYDQSIFSKLIEIEKKIAEVKKNPDPQSVLGLRNTVHQTGGSAGSYGYPEVSSLCRNLDEVLSQELLEISQNPKHVLKIPDLNHFFSELKLKFQRMPTGEVQNEKLNRLPLFVVTQDKSFVGEVINTGKANDFIFEDNPQTANDKIADDNFNPRFIIADDPWIFELIKVHKKKKNPLFTHFGMFTLLEELPKRVEAIRQGVEYVFHKPLEINLFISSLEDILNDGIVNGYRVLVVDDDRDSAAFLSNALNEIGMETKVIHEGLPFFKELAKDIPDCIILDINLPGYNGIELLKALRADMKYRNLPVLLATMRNDAMVKEAAFTLHVSDILYKPFNKQMIQKTLFNLSKR